MYIRMFKKWLKANKAISQHLGAKDAFIEACGESAFWDLVSQSRATGKCNLSDVNNDVLEAKELIEKAYRSA